MSGKVPDAPTGVYGISLDSEVQLTWVAPVDIGGSALLHYTIYTTPAIDSSCGDVGDIARCESYSTASGCDADAACSWDSTVSDSVHCSVRCSMVVDDGSVTATVPGLTNGVWYRFEVTATNAKGSSARSTWPGNCAAGAGTASTAVTEAACIATEGSVWYDAYDPHGGVAPGAVRAGGTS